MKIRMLTTSAGPQGVRLMGSVYDVPNEEGIALVEGEYAEVVAASKPVPKVDPESKSYETATEEQAEKTTTTSRRGRK